MRGIPSIGAILRRNYASRAVKEAQDSEFRVLDFLKRRQRITRPPIKREPAPPPRALAMSTEQHWPSVWPGPRTFHPGTVPLPLRQGYPLKNQPPPSAKANAELMKIPNFLHLTPPAVKAQCEAIKKFCTPWPSNVDLEKHFSLEVITSDYCHSGPSIRDPLARIVSIRFKLSDIQLNDHARDKLRRLVGDRYDEKTDILTIVTERCPSKQQNLDYAMYLMTAIYYESWKIEPWEKEKMEADMQVYIWDNNKSKKTIVDLHNWKLDGEFSLSDDEYKSYDVSSIPNAREYSEAVSELINEGENDYQLNKYKQSVLRLLGLPAAEELPVSRLNKA